MLGYVRCQAGDMLLKHHRLYGAMYCGLCHTAKKKVTRALTPFLSYDFVFLAFLRLLATGEKVELEKQFCLLHPFRDKNKRVADNDALRLSAFAMLFLTYEKMRDDLLDRDCSVGRKFLVSLFIPVLKRKCQRAVKRNPAYFALWENVSETMQRERALEKEGAGLDAMCSSFADCLSFVFSFGLEGQNGRILAAIGDKLGRFLYTLDAVDDLEKDERSGAFNPILTEYGAFSDAGTYLGSLDRVISFYVQEMKRALDLLEGDRDLFMICEHIICLGLPGAVKKIMKQKMETCDERSL